MDTRGNIYRMTDEERRAFEQMRDAPLIPLDDSEAKELEPMSKSKRKGYMRNKPCLCGSGKKFKKCCWSLYT